MEQVAIAIHGNENVDFSAYTNHLSMIAIAASTYKLSLLTTRGIRIAQARNAIVKKLEEFECKYVLFLDTDHLVPKNMVNLLMDSIEECSCVSGLVCRRKDTMDQVGYLKNGNEYTKIKLVPNSGVYEVDVCAFGCTLIRTKVFNDLTSPVFRDESKEKDNGEVFNMRSDVVFCNELKSKDHKIMIDTRVVVGHIGEPVVVWPWNGHKLRELNEKRVLGSQYS